MHITMQPVTRRQNIVSTALAMVLALLMFGMLGGFAAAQSVPVRGDDGWVLPVSDGLNLAPTSDYEAPGAVTGGYESTIHDACARHGCDPYQLIRVMGCESGGDHSAVGPSGERGIFQFHPNGEWPYAAWYSAYDQIELAAELFAAGYAGSWVCK